MFPAYLRYSKYVPCLHIKYSKYVLALVQYSKYSKYVLALVQYSKYSKFVLALVQDCTDYPHGSVSHDEPTFGENKLNLLAIM